VKKGKKEYKLIKQTRKNIRRW